MQITGIFICSGINGKERLGFIFGILILQLYTQQTFLSLRYVQTMTSTSVYLHLISEDDLTV